MSRIIVKAQTDQTVILRILNTDGTPKTDAVYNTSGLVVNYWRGGSVVAITLASLAGVNAAHADGGFIHIGAGYYRVDLPDAAVVGGYNHVLVWGTLTGTVIQACYVQLQDLNIFSTAVSATLAANVITASVLATDAVQEIRDSILAGTVDTVGSRTVKQVLSVMAAVLAGRTDISGSTIIFQAEDGSAARLTVTMSGAERAAVTWNPSA